MKSTILMVLAVCGGLALATPPVLSNVRASQRAGTKLVDIYYDAADADGDLLKVRVEISDNDGVKYSVPARTFTGDIGEGVRPGSSRHIVWDAGTDWDGEYSDRMRVKVFAIDAKGFPGMEWGNEVPPGGFLLGQDGGVEGAGESQHVSVPWSFWLSKYEVTNQQYCDFLNAALATGIIGRNGASNVYATASMPAGYACPVDTLLCWVGDDWGIRWSVNNFEVVSGRGDRPAIATWYGAMAFCRFYGYDLPTEAEWEKAARGPDHDDQDEHVLYPWGNTTASASYASTTYKSSIDYGIYTGSDKKNLALGNVSGSALGASGYGVHGMIGNGAEWTRTDSSGSVGDYPLTESLKARRQLPFAAIDRVVKGKGGDAIYKRNVVDPAQWYLGEYDYSDWCYKYYLTGFRPVRRTAGVADSVITREVYEDFETLTADAVTFTHGGKTWRTDYSDYGTYNEYKLFGTTVGVNNGRGVGNPPGDSYSFSLYLPSLNGSLCLIRLKARNFDGWACSISCGSDLGNAGYVELPAYMPEFRTVEIPVLIGASGYYLDIPQKVNVDEIELWTIAK